MMGYNMTDWGDFENKVFIFDCEQKKLLTSFHENDPEFLVNNGGVYGMQVNKPGHWLHSRNVTVVRPYIFDDDYYTKFDNPPKIIQKCWRMLQLDRLVE